MATYTGTYLNSSDMIDVDLRAIAENSINYIVRGEAWFTNLCDNYGVTAPEKASITENQKRAIEIYIYRLICQSNMGRNFAEVQGGVLDKYAYKMQIYSAELYGSSGGSSSVSDNPVTRSLAQISLLDVVQEELQRGLDEQQPTIEYNL